MSLTVRSTNIVIAIIIGLILRKIKNKKSLYKGKRSGLPRLSKKRNRIIISIMWSTLLVYKIILGFIFVLQSPTYQDDSLDKRNMRAKVFYERKSLVTDKNDNEYLGMISEPYNFEKEKSIPLRSYPPNNSLSKTRIALRIWEFKDPLINIVNPIFYTFLLATILVLVTRLTQSTNRGILSATIMAWIPYLRIHATNPYAELFVSGYLAITWLSLLLAIKDHSNKLWRNIVIILHPLIIATKKEWFVIAFFVLTIIGLYQRSLEKYQLNKITNTIIETIKKSRLYISVTIFWITYQFITWYWKVFLSHHSGGKTQFHPEIFQIYKHVLLEEGNYNLIALVVILAIVFWRKTITKTYLKYGYILFSLVFLIIFYSLSSTGAFVEAQQEVWINRAFIAYMPFLITLIVINVYEYFKSHKLHE